MKLTPSSIMATVAAITAVLTLAVVMISVHQPWIGIRLGPIAESDAVRILAVDPQGPSSALQPGSRLAAVAGQGAVPVALRAGDVVEEPDIAETYQDLEIFLARQDLVHTALRQDRVALTLDDGRVVQVSPAASRTLSSLPVVFWVQIFVGSTGFLIGGWVWSLRRTSAKEAGENTELGPTLLFTTSVGLLTFSFAAAVYSTRELALDGSLFRALSAANHFGAVLFGGSLIALFLIYPRRLVRPRLLLLLPVIFGVWWGAATLRIGFTGPPTGSHLAVSIQMMGILLAAGLQYWSVRHDLAQRAAMRWFGLSIAIGAGAFVLIIIAPNLFGVAPALSQGFAFPLFLLVYAGVALGVARYRLFELDAWAFRILFYLAGGVLLLLLDAALVYMLAIDRAPALGLALIAVSLAYLPLRDRLQRMLIDKPVNHGALFQQVVDVALSPLGADQNARWQEVSKRAFRPLSVETLIGDNSPTPMIIKEGVSLVLPGVAGIAPLRLSHAHAGRKLFSRADLTLAEELCVMLTHASQSRAAREQGMTEERIRISRDIHDNIGAKLLSALHSPAEGRKDAMIREALSDLRGVINNAADQGQPLVELLAELRLETAERLEAAGVELTWEAAADGGALLSATALHTLRSIVREAVSNIIRHAEATKTVVIIACHEGRASCTISDNGRGMTQAPGDGAGLGNIRARLAALGGTVEFSNADPGLSVIAAFPVRESGTA